MLCNCLQESPITDQENVISSSKPRSSSPTVTYPVVPSGVIPTKFKGQPVRIFPKPPPPYDVVDDDDIVLSDNEEPIMRKRPLSHRLKICLLKKISVSRENDYYF